MAADYEVDFAKRQASPSNRCGRPDQFLRPRSPPTCRPRSSDRWCRRNSPDFVRGGLPQHEPAEHNRDNAAPGHVTRKANERASPTYEPFARRPSPSYEPYQRNTDAAPHPAQTQAAGPEGGRGERGREGGEGQDADDDWQWSRGNERDAQREAYVTRKKWEQQLDERVALLLEEEAREKAQRAAKRQVRRCERVCARCLNSVLRYLWRGGALLLVLAHTDGSACMACLRHPWTNCQA